jgi:hypothetical protein
MPEIGPCEPRIHRWTSGPRRLGAVVVAALFLLSLSAGCGDDEAERRRAYEQAEAAVAREKATLDNMELERRRLEGEQRLHEFQARVWTGEFVPHKLLGIDLGREQGKDLSLVRFFYRKWPLGWFGRLDRLLARSPQVLPWLDRRAGEAYGTKVKERYVRQLKDLDVRLAIQKDRIRAAEEYAEIVRPNAAAN